MFQREDAAAEPRAVLAALEYLQREARRSDLHEVADLIALAVLAARDAVEADPCRQ